MKSSSRILIGYAVALAVIAILTFFTYRNFKTVTTSSVGYKNTLSILKNIEFVYADVLLMENECKGYVISGKNELLKKYSEAKITSVAQMDSLKKYSATAIKVKTLTDSIDNDLKSEIKFIDKVIALKQNKKSNTQATIKLLNNNPYLSAIEKNVAAIESIGRNDINKFADEESSRERKTLIIFVFLSFSVFIFLGIVFYKILKTNNARVDAEHQLKKLNEDLEFQVQKKSAELNIVFERITDAVIALDKNWNYTYLNEKAEELHGRSAKDLIGKNIWKEFPYAVNEPIYALLHESMEKQIPVIRQVHYSTSDNWYDYFIYPSPDGVSVYYRDVTEKKQIESDLKKSETNYQQLLEQASDAILIADKNFHVINANSSAVVMLGYTPEELLKRTIKDLFFEEELKADPLRFDELYKGLSVLTERNMKCKNGLPVQVEINSKMLPDGRFQGIVRNITERKNIEQKKLIAEQKYRLLFERNLSGIYRTEFGGKILDCNDACAKIFGYDSATDFLSRTAHDLYYNEQDRNDFLKILKEKKSIFNYEVKMKRKNGTPVYLIENTMLFESPENPEGILEGIVIDLTEKKKAENELQKSEDKFRMLIENSHDGIGLLNQFGEIIYISPAGERITGFRNEELLGKKIFEFFHPEGSDIAQEFFTKLFNNPGVTLNDTGARLMHKDGKYIQVEANVTNLLHDENVKAIIANFRDITERIKSEEALENSKLSYKLLIEQAPDGVFISDSNYYMNIVNASGCLMLGYELSELQNMKFTELISPENLKNNPINLEVMNSGKTSLSERTLIRKDGSAVSVEINAKLLSDRRFQAFIRDVSERKRIEDDLLKSEHNYKTLIEQAPDGVFITSPEHLILEVNVRGCKLLGYELSEFQKMKFPDLISIESLNNKPVNFEELSSGETIISERNLLRKDGIEIPVEISARRLSDGRFQSFVRDISERKKIKEELRDMNTRLRSLTSHIQNAIEEERKHIAREIHDELGQLLTGLKIDLSWMNKRQGLSEELTLKTEEMLSLTDRTIQSVRKIATELRPGILDDLGLNEAIIWQANEFQNKTGIECKVQGEILRTDYSPEQNITAFRIMQESLTNVMRHANANHVMITLDEKENFLTLVITDDGIGIVNMHNFEQKSLGILGMKERVNIIGGSLSIFSEPNHGTTVTVKIPLTLKK